MPIEYYIQFICRRACEKKPSAFRVCDSLSFGLTESRLLKALIKWVLGQ